MKNIVLLISLFTAQVAIGQDINTLLNKAKAKIETVNDYEATATMKTNVAFLKVPVAKVKIYFKKPNKLKLKS
jgi:outer membrane lipoprotein-sorting protein